MSNPGPVFSAGKTQRVGDAVPTVNMKSSILGWFRPITVEVIQQTTDEQGNVTFTPRALETSGVIQPIVEKLKRYREGGRSWAAWELHCLPNFILNTNDRVTIRGRRFSVMGRTDYSENGFVIYDLQQLPQDHGD